MRYSLVLALALGLLSLAATPANAAPACDSTVGLVVCEGDDGYCAHTNVIGLWNEGRHCRSGDGYQDECIKTVASDWCEFSWPGADERRVNVEGVDWGEQTRDGAQRCWIIFQSFTEYYDCAIAAPPSPSMLGLADHWGHWLP